jgi:5-methylcytosine-specific restriction endonuclease McrA
MTRRARHVGAAVNGFSRFDVYERDGWVCHICHEPVDRAVEWPHPRSVSLDHVIPLNEPDSPGHVFANTACAHLFCNHSKNARTRYEDRALFVALDATGRPPLVGALF